MNHVHAGTLGVGQPLWHRVIPEGSSSHTLVLARTPPSAT